MTQVLRGSRRGMALAMLLAVGGILGAPPAWGQDGEPAPTRPPGRVVLVAMPHLTWGDLRDHEDLLPRLHALLERSAVAQLSVRTVGARTTLPRAYTTIGAGNRATVHPSYGALGLDRDEQEEEGPAAVIWERRAGERTDAPVLHIGFETVARANARLFYGTVPGALADALRAEGRSTAVVANSDTHREHGRDRSAVLAMMGARGTVDGGTVGEELLADDPTAPFGLRADPDAHASAVRAALAAHDVVLVEAGDLSRAERYRPVTTRRAGLAHHRAALAAADDLLGSVLDAVDLDEDVVIVLAPVAPASVELPTVFAMAGPDVGPGSASSPSTRRDGYVTLPDIGPTVLDRLGVARPSEMTGTPITVSAGDPITDADLERLDASALLAAYRDAATGPVVVTFIILQVAIYGLAVIALTGDRRRWRPAVAVASLGVLALPTATFLSGLFPYDALDLGAYTVLLVAVSAAAAGGAWALGRLAARRLGAARGMFVAPLLLCGATWSMLVVDLLTGGWLQINTVMGYSPIVAGRFAGLGNLAFTLLLASAVGLVACGWAMATAGRANRPVWLLPSAVGVLAVTVVVNGHPALGSDVGGVLAAVPAAVVLLMMLLGKRLTVARLTLIGLATGLVISGFAGLDLLRPEEDRTHLGRFVERLFRDGGAVEVLERKARTNLNILTSSVWTLVIPFAVAFVIFLVGRDRRYLGALQQLAPATRALIWGSITLGVLGFLLNDSGVVIPSTMLGVLLPVLVVLILQLPPTAELPVDAVPGSGDDPG